MPIVGTWAMVPLSNGIANVAEFTAEGKSTLHVFNCGQEPTNETEVSTYKINNERKFIRINQGDTPIFLYIAEIKDDTMLLRQIIGDEVFNLNYIKVDQVSPLCDRKEALQKELGQTPYKPSDFEPNPIIPEAPGLERYEGKWMNKEGQLIVEIHKDANGQYSIQNQSTRDWNYLYSLLNHDDKSLVFIKFTYSDRPILFNALKHKLQIIEGLTPIESPDQIKYTYFLGFKKYSEILTRQ
ncbi:hypothetical protein BFW38_11175 [Terasakiispira papahanaumokuakeensis]|uniref:Uncharacterized protein n=2 Tax=Terasakiispira papahanaumokuakeensis TaxID=197479 RepID=A0A1E2VAL9_9GAMM|nr:hypothetical protein BFW38_11175 [Terasakiispira papahanaumokuakeensis]